MVVCNNTDLESDETILGEDIGKLFLDWCATTAAQKKNDDENGGELDGETSRLERENYAYLTAQ